jgi:hypothetical protein
MSSAQHGEFHSGWQQLVVVIGRKSASAVKQRQIRRFNRRDSKTPFFL